MKSSQLKIMFFDGNCLLCNKVVLFFLKIDKFNILFFAPIQGTTAEKLIPLDFRSNINTFIYLKDNNISIKSTALCNVLYDLGGIYKFISSIIYLIPQSIRDWIYDFIAKYRFKIWIQSNQCILPSIKNNKRILN